MTISSPQPIQSPRTLTVLLAVAIFALAAPQRPLAQAKSAQPAPVPDVIVFTNGDQLSGTVERGEGDSIVFKSDMAGQITVPFAKIKELRAHGTFALLRKDTKTLTTDVKEGTVSYSGSKVTLTVPTGGSESVEPKNVGFLIDKPTYDKQINGHPSLLSGWKGSVTAGATFVRSTDNGSTYTAGTTLVRALPLVPYLPPKSKSIFNLSETYGKLTQPTIPQTVPPTPTSIAETSIFHAGFEQDEYFSPRFYVLGNTSFDHNFSQGLNLQQVYGGGVGWTPIKSGKQQLDVKADIHYEKQTFSQSVAATTPNQNLIGSTIAEFYHRTLPLKIVFNENADILPAYNDTNAYSADATVGFVLPVYKRLGVSFTSTDNFLNDPAVGYKKNTFQFVTGATYTLP